MSARLENKLGGRAVKAGLDQFMRPHILIAVLLIGLFSFAALFTLSGFAGDLKSKNNGRAHALSNSAIGYSGIVFLLRAGEQNVVLDRTDDFENKDRNILRVITLSDPYQFPKGEDIDKAEPTFIVLPKWRVIETKEHAGWVRIPEGVSSPIFNELVLSAGVARLLERVSVRQVKKDDGTFVYDLASNEISMPDLPAAKIRHLQSLEGGVVVPIIRANGKVILGRLPGTKTYILSEPDILNTMGISQKSRALYARDVLTGMQELSGANKGQLTFDLHIHGFGRTQNLIKTLLSPPFLAATLCLLAAGVLVAWQAFARFGDPVPEERDYALGKYTLADNGARFIRIAGKETGMAEGYVQVVTRLAAKDFHMDKQSQDKIEAFFASRERKLGLKSGWSKLTAHLGNTADKVSFLSAAKALYKWRQEITHDRK